MTCVVTTPNPIHTRTVVSQVRTVVGTLQPMRNSDPSCASPHVLSSIWFSLLHVIMSTMSLLTCSSSSPTLQRAEHADDPDESLQNSECVRKPCPEGQQQCSRTWAALHGVTRPLIQPRRRRPVPLRGHTPAWARRCWGGHRCYPHIDLFYSTALSIVHNRVKRFFSFFIQAI